jgi:hypothetical protein
LAQRKQSRKVGRPRMPKGEAKGRIVPVRFTADDLKAMAAAAKANNQTVSQWIRSTIMGRVNPTNILTHCNICDKAVTALVMVPPDKLIATLQQPGAVRVIHTAQDGDHIMILSNHEKDNLRNAIAKGAL